MILVENAREAKRRLPAPRETETKTKRPDGERMTGQNDGFVNMGEGGEQTIGRFGLHIGQVMFVLALVVGLSAGLAAYVYFWMTEAAVRELVHLYRNAPGLLSSAALIITPAVGGLLTGYIFHYFAPDAKGGGVPEVIDALLHKDGYIRLRVGFFKALASVICIGSGGSTGREGPVVQIGASVGSALAQMFKITRRRAQLLVACGAAAGIAAVFNAPIAGAFFAAEVIIGSFAMRDLTLLFTAAACSMVVARSLLWNHAQFPTPAYEFHVGWALIFHLILGVLMALAGHALISTMHGVEHKFRHSRIPEMWRPAVGGLMLGVLGVGLSLPQVFGTGADAMEEFFNGHFFTVGAMDGLFTGPHLGPMLAMLLLLAVGKMLATSFTLGSGGAGGDLMPAMFIGGALGGAYGLILQRLVPGTTLPPGAFALVGALGVFAGIAHAPMTAIILGIEVTYNYGLVLPLMMCCSASALMSSWLRTSSVYVLKLEERGIDVKAIRGRRNFPADPLDRVHVEDIMTRSFARVAPGTTVSELLDLFAESSHHGFLVVDDIDRLVGIVTLSDVQRALPTLGDDESTPVTEIMTKAKDVVSCFPAQTLKDALLALGSREVGRIPVMDPLNTAQVIGVLRRSDILRGSRNAAKLSGNTAAPGGKGGRTAGFNVTAQSPWAGRQVRRLGLPEGVLLISLRRGAQVMVPNGDTLIAVGDYVTALVQPDAAEAFAAWRSGEPDEMASV
jgi:CIC family chloride channel protein